jgi:hypothetical protein
MKLMALTFVGTTELIAARWSEFDIALSLSSPLLPPSATRAEKIALW